MKKLISSIVRSGASSGDNFSFETVDCEFAICKLLPNPLYSSRNSDSLDSLLKELCLKGELQEGVISIEQYNEQSKALQESDSRERKKFRQYDGEFLRFNFEIKSGSGFSSVLLAIGGGDLMEILKEIATKMPSEEMRDLFSECGGIVGQRLEAIEQEKAEEKSKRIQKQNETAKLNNIFEAWKKCTNPDEKVKLEFEGFKLGGAYWNSSLR